MLQSPNELGPRAALLQHYNVVKQHTEQSKSRVSCKGCSHTFAGKTTRMAALQTAGESVSLCKSPPEGATDAATAHFSAREKKRVTTKKRKVDNDAIDSKQLSIWKMLDGKGHDSANAAFARMVFAHGLSFNIGTSKYLLDVMEEARYLVFVSFSFLCLASFLPTRHMLSVYCHKYTKTHETLTNTVLCTLMQTSWEVGTLAWALIR